MTTFYKKAFLIAAAAFLIEAILVYFLYTSINAFYSNLTKNIAFLLSEKVSDIINAENLNWDKLDQYSRYPTRKLLKRLSGTDSEILHILVVDTTMRILVSDDASAEGKVYRDSTELQLFKTDVPKIIGTNRQGTRELLNVIYPIVQDSIKRGYLRTVISVKHLDTFYKNRRVIIFLASIISFIIIIFTVYFASRIYRSSLLNIQQALEKVGDSEFQYRMDFQKKDEFAPLFSRLNELFQTTLDLNASFQQSENRIKVMMKGIHEGFCLIDEQENIVSFNEYLVDIFELTNPDKAEENVKEIFEMNPRLHDIYVKAMDPMTHSVRKDMTIRLLQNKTTDVQVNALAIHEAQESRHVIFYIKNLAMLQELEQNLSRSMKYTIISQLASSIGHEIRNPLSSLAIHTEVLNNLTERMPDNNGNSARVRKSLGILNSEIERLTKLIDQFFNLARNQEVKLSLENINDVLREVIELSQQEAYEKNIEIKVQMGSSLPLVTLVKDQMKQVFLNIILNAFDAMPGGGRLIIGTRLLDNMVAVAIRDSGKGITPEAGRKIFDLYYSTKKNGGGIGLAISKKIVDAHEGRIYFKTKLNVGTSFIIELPVAKNS